MSVGLYVV